MFQSTHPRRVWLFYFLLSCWQNSFNPHTHEGCDSQKSLKSTGVASSFQSTHPRRVWRNIDYLAPTDNMFQSTHPRRVWPVDSSISLQKSQVSIHTPTKGVTGKHSTDKTNALFQSTHPRRVWQISALRSATALQFQSTHPRRVWLHIQQIAEYHDAKIIILRKMAK